MQFGLIPTSHAWQLHRRLAPCPRRYSVEYDVTAQRLLSRFTKRWEGEMVGRTSVLARWTGGLIGVILAAGTMPVYAEEGAVYPTGQFPLDVTNLQAAADRGGTVVLKATNRAGQPTSFNFGPPQLGSGEVTLAGSVALVGERGHSARTTIYGGSIPVTSVPGARVRISGIDFEYSFWIAIAIDDAADAKIIDNRIEHVLGRFFPSLRHPPGFTVAEGLDLGGGETASVRNNTIDDIRADLGLGISQYGNRGRVDITGNRVTGTNTLALETSSSGGQNTVADNYLAPGAPTSTSRAAIGTGLEVNGGAGYRIEGNHVVCVNPIAICMFLFGSTTVPGFTPLTSALVRDNHVEALGSLVDGIVLFGQVSGVMVKDNQITGNGESALAAFCRDSASDLSSNRFLDNDIASFSGSLASVYFDTCSHDNVFTGFCGTVIDLGTHNQITCEEAERESAQKPALAGARPAAPTVGRDPVNADLRAESRLR